MTTAITYSEGLMSGENEIGNRSWAPAFTQSAAVLMAVALGSGGAVHWGQTGFHDLLHDHERAQREELAHLRGDIEDLRQQVVGSHNLLDIVRIQLAISDIDPDDSRAWTGDGKPRIYAIEARLIERGYPYLRVTASLRDMAWGLSRMSGAR